MRIPTAAIANHPKHSRPACMGTPRVLVGRVFETNGTDEPMQAFPLLPCNNPRRNTSMNYIADNDPRPWDPLDVTLSSRLRKSPCGQALHYYVRCALKRRRT